jgi:pimeloyl-ACP methyl ester carboxylesterase
MKTCESLYVDIRGLRYHVRSWGRPGAPKLFLTHGWMDVSASFQFFVDALSRDWQVLAPDWRGYGLSQWSGADTYWYHEFIGDLDRLLAHFQPDSPVLLLGHSMGGSICSMYAGIRPDRVRRLINVDSLGTRPSTSADTPAQYAKWLAWLRHHPHFPAYPSYDALAARLLKEHPRLAPERAQYLARHWGRDDGKGGIELSSDPRHRDMYSRNIAFKPSAFYACWGAVTAPVLLVLAENGSLQRSDLTPELIRERRALYRNSRQVEFADTGHMIHLERPERLAEEVEAFLADC